MKEDAQLTCPISFEDPNDLWKDLQDALNEELPLRDVTWKSPMSSTFITISTLPLRFLPSSANLFKETDHAYRWFLAPYVQLYLLGAESLDSYRAVKPSLKKWVDQKNSQNGILGKIPWFIVYIPLGGYGMDTYNKVYSRISSDFYFERYGDRSVMIPILNGGQRSFNTQHIANSNNSMFGELFSLLREGVVQSFQHRYSLYNLEIRKLDATRGTPTFDFRQLFLVKESLALMLQMLQLLDHALKQYEELEAILSYANISSLPTNDWPMIAPEQLKTGETSEQQQSSIPTKEREKDSMSDAIKNGEEIVAYSINLARMKILKSKLSALELHRYVFARQIFFLIALQRAPICALKARTFLLFTCTAIEKRIIQESNASEEISTPLSPPSSSSKSSRMPILLSLRAKQAEVWALTAAIKIVRVCKDLVSKIIETENVMNMKEQMGHSVNRQSLIGCILAYKRSAGMSFYVDEGSSSALESSSNVLSSALNEKLDAIKETYRTMAEIMEFAMRRFRKLTPVLHISRKITLQINQSVLNGNESTAFNEQTDEMSPDQYFDVFQQDSKSILASTMRMELEALHTEKKDSLDNALVSIAQRVRSASHFWAKLYSCPPSPKKFGYVLEHYAYASKESNLGVSHFQRGRSLELSLSILLHEALWELYLACERFRFACSSKLQVASLLMCCDQNALCCQILDSLLFNAERLHSDSEIRYINVKLSPHNVMHWTDLRLWALTIYVSTTLKLGSASRYQAGLAQLVITKQTSPQYDEQRGAQNSIEKAAKRSCSHLVEELTRCSGGTEGTPVISTTTSLVASIALSGKIRNLFRIVDKPLMAAHPILIPLTAMARVKLDRLQANGISNSAKILRSVELIQDDSFPAQVIEFHGNEPFSQILRLNWPYDHTCAIGKLCVVYKRIQNHVFDRARALVVAKTRRSSFVLHDFDDELVRKSSRSGSVVDDQLQVPSELHKSPTRQLSKQVMSSLNRYFEASDDEFLCQVKQMHDNGLIEGPLTLSPGENVFQLEISPNGLGEFGLDRIIFNIGNLVFLDKPLFREQSDYDNSSLISRPLTPFAGSDYQFPRVNIEELEAMPLNHNEIQQYLNDFALVKVAEPTHILQANVFMAEISPPPPTADFCIISLGTQNDEQVQEVIFNIETCKESRFIGRKKGLEASYQQYTLNFGSSKDQQTTSQNKPTLECGNSSSSLFLSPIKSQVEATIDHSSFPVAQLVMTEAIQDSWAVSGGEDFMQINAVSDWEIFASAKDNFDKNDIKWTKVRDLIDKEVNENVSLKLDIVTSGDGKDLLRVQGISANTHLLMKIPFSIAKIPDLESSSDEQIMISQCKISIDGEMLKNQCQMPFRMSFTQQVACGHLLFGRATRAIRNLGERNNAMQILQMKYFNIGPQTMVLVGYSLLCRSKTMDDQEDFANIESTGSNEGFEIITSEKITMKRQPTILSFVESDDMERLRSSKSSNLLLAPEEEFAMNVIFTFNNNEDYAQSPVIVRLWFAVHTDNITKQMNTAKVDSFHAIYFLDKLAVDTCSEVVHRNNEPSVDVFDAKSNSKLSCVSHSLEPFVAICKELTMIKGIINYSRNGSHLDPISFRVESMTSIDYSCFDSSALTLSSEVELVDDLIFECSSLQSTYWLVLGTKLNQQISSEHSLGVSIVAIPLNIGIVPIPGLEVNLRDKNDRITSAKKLYPIIGESVTIARIIPVDIFAEESENVMMTQASWFSQFDQWEV